METKRRQQAGYFFGSILLLVGVLLLFLRKNFVLFVFTGLALLFLLYGLFQVYLLFAKKGGAVKTSRFNIFLTVLLALFFLNNALIPTGVLAWFVTIEFFAVGLILLIDFVMRWRNQSQPSLLRLVDGLVHFSLGLITLLNIDNSLDGIFTLFGLSLIVRGLNHLYESWQMDQIVTKTRGRRRRLGLPIFLSALFPVQALKTVNKFLSPVKSQPILLNQKQKEGQKPDLEIWIHTARKGFEMFGHVDVSYKGVTYGYGQYDVDNSHLFGMIGDGVLFRLSSQDYMDSLAKEDWRAVVGYGMILTEEQKRAIENRLAKIMERTVPFVLTSRTQRQSYLGQLSNHYGVESFKFSSSAFKTYFVMTTNCVLLADTILEAIGTDNVASHGILTPGIYQDYFENVYQNPASNVVTKFVLGKQEGEAPSV